MLRNVGTDDASDALSETLPGADSGIFVLAFDGGPELLKNGRAFDSEEEGENEDENDVSGDLGDGADTGDEDITEVADEVVREVFDGGEDFALEIVDAKGLTETIDAIPATDGAFKGSRELTDELDRLINDDGNDDGHNKPEDNNYNAVGDDRREGGIVFFEEALDAASKGLNSNSQEDSNTDDNESGQSFPDEQAD